MSSTITHALVGSFVAVTAFDIVPADVGHIAAAVVAATVVDLDHLFYVVKDRHEYRRNGLVGFLHNARSSAHELMGFVAAGSLATLIFPFDPKLSCIIFTAFGLHVLQDWFLGKSQPLFPLDLTVVQFFSLNLKQKTVVEAVLLVTFSLLWIRYLFAAV